MSTLDAVVAAVGPRLVHVTPTTNISRILSDGLKPAAVLACEADVDPRSILLRKSRVTVGAASLTHQLPLVQGLKSARDVLDGHTPESWSAALDKRVFFWPGKRGTAFAKSGARDTSQTHLHFDTRLFAQALWSRLDLAPINTGNFCRSGARARRGDWIYWPIADGMAGFRTNRINHGLVTSPDSVVELSVSGSIPAEILSGCLIDTGD